MLAKLSYKQKNKLLIPLVVVGLILAWVLAFSNTFNAFLLHRTLVEQSKVATDLSFNPKYLLRKQEALSQILKGYKVDKDWTDVLWLRSSHLAASQNVGLDYTLTKPLTETDSTKAGIVQSLYFYGNYRQLVKLMDTLEKSPRIGKISAIQVKAPKADLTSERTNKNMLRIDFKALEMDVSQKSD